MWVPSPLVCPPLPSRRGTPCGCPPLVCPPLPSRGPPCGCPPPSYAPLYHLVGAPLVGALPLVCPPLPSRRGTPCGCPSSAIVASQFRCDCPGPPRPSVDQKGLRCSPWPSVALRGQKEVKVFSAPLRGPPWTKRSKVFSPPFVALRGQKGLRCSPRPSVDKKPKTKNCLLTETGRKGYDSPANFNPFTLS